MTESRKMSVFGSMFKKKEDVSEMTPLKGGQGRSGGAGGKDIYFRVFH